MSSCAGFRAFGVNMIQLMSITMQVLTYAVTICTIIRRMRTGIKWLEKLRFLDVNHGARNAPYDAGTLNNLPIMTTESMTYPHPPKCISPCLQPLRKWNA
jgi:hypothetical protein